MYLDNHIEVIAMKREEKQNTKRAKYEKPTVTKFKKLTDVVAAGSPGKEPT